MPINELGLYRAHTAQGSYTAYTTQGSHAVQKTPNRAPTSLSLMTKITEIIKLADLDKRPQILHTTPCTSRAKTSLQAKIGLKELFLRGAFGTLGFVFREREVRLGR